MDPGPDAPDGWLDEIEDPGLRDLLRAARGAHREMPEPEAAQVLQRILARVRARPRRRFDSVVAGWTAASAAAALAAWAALVPARAPHVSGAPQIVKRIRFECVREGKAMRLEMTLRRIPETRQEDDDATVPSQ